MSRKLKRITFFVAYLAVFKDEIAENLDFFMDLFIQVHSYDSELKIKISESTVGKYICRASVQGFREVTASAEVFMHGPPRILRQNEFQV